LRQSSIRGTQLAMQCPLLASEKELQAIILRLGMKIMERKGTEARIRNAMHISVN